MQEDEIETIRQRIREDRRSGIQRSLKDYVDLFPADEILVARAFGGLGEEVSASSPDGLTLGPYRAIRELGRGGQGVVYLARDTRVGREVALKVLVGLGSASEEVLRRFRREAEITSRLDHPGICPVFATGLADETPWIAMRYVKGRPLSALINQSKTGTADGEDEVSEWVDLSQLVESRTGGEGGAEARMPGAEGSAPGGSTQSRDEMMAILTIIEKTARALHAAHETGVIHRDVKPGNIMVTDGGDPVVLDFGLASADAEGQATLTQSGDLMGTPSYMSPEQIAARRSGIDRRTDVYSLGVTLYECLTLRRPFDAPTREGLYREILTREAPDPAKVNPRLPPELRIVLETAMAKEPGRRYITAEEFADDLRRVRALEPIAARRVSRWLRTKRWAQRNPGVAVSSAVTMVVLLGGLIATAIQKREADRQRVLAEGNAQEAREARDLERTAKEEAIRASLREEVGRRRAGAEANVLEAEREDLTGGRVLPLAYAVASLRHQATPRAADLAWRLRNEVGRLRWISPDMARPGQAVTHGALSADGSRFVGALADGTVRVWDTSSKQEIRKIEAQALGVAISPDGACLAVSLLDGPSRSSRLWDVATGQALPAMEGGDAVFSPDGALVATSLRGSLRVRRLATGQDLPDPKMAGSPMAFSPDGALLVTSPGAPSYLWDIETGRRRQEVSGATGLAAFDGKHIVSGGGLDGVMTLWDAATGKELKRLEGHESQVTCLAISRDGARILSGSADETVRLWETASGGELLKMPAHTHAVVAVAFTGDRSRLVSASKDGTVRSWDPNTGEELSPIAGHTLAVTAVAFSHDGTRVVSGSSDTTARVWDVATGRQLRAFDSAEVWDLAGARPESPIPPMMSSSAPVTCVAFSPDGTRITSGADSSWGATTAAAVSVRDLTTDRELRLVPPPDEEGRYLDGAVISLAFSPDGSRLVAGYEQELIVWDASDGSVLRRTGTGANSNVISTFSPAGDRLVHATSRGKIVIGDVETEKVWSEMEGADRDPRCVGFSRDGTRVVAGMGVGTVCVWDASTGRKLATMGHRGPVVFAAFGPDGSFVVSAADDETVRVWDMETGKELRRLVVPGLRCAALSRDGTRIVCGAGNASRLWEWGTDLVLRKLSVPAIGGFDLHGPLSYLSAGRPNDSAVSRDGTRLVTAHIGSDVTSNLHESRVGSIELRRGLHEMVRRPDPAVWVADWKTVGHLTGRNGAAGAEVDWRRVGSLKGHAGAVDALAFSPDGRRIATGSRDETARIWDAETTKELLFLQGHRAPVNGLSFSPDGARLVSSDRDGSSRIWNAETGELVRAVEGDDAARPVAFDSAGTRILCIGGDAMLIWDAKTATELRRLEGHTGPVVAAAFSADGSRIVSGSRDRTARVWDVTTGQELRSVSVDWGLVSSVGFSRDGTRIFTSARGNAGRKDQSDVRMWDADTGEELRTLRPGSAAVPTRTDADRAWVAGVAVGPGGKTLASCDFYFGADDFNRAYEWDADTGVWALEVGPLEARLHYAEWVQANLITTATPGGFIMASEGRVRYAFAEQLRHQQAGELDTHPLLDAILTEWERDIGLRVDLDSGAVESIPCPGSAYRGTPYAEFCR